MQSVNIHDSGKSVSVKVIWAGRAMHWLCVSFILLDAVMKIAENHYHVEGTTQLGWSAAAVRPLGLVLLGSAILYLVPRTSGFGLILITAYLGGAVATMARIGEPFYFPILLCVMVWVSACIRNQKLRTAILRSQGS